MPFEANCASLQSGSFLNQQGQSVSPVQHFFNIVNHHASHLSSTSSHDQHIRTADKLRWERKKIWGTLVYCSPLWVVFDVIILICLTIFFYAKPSICKFQLHGVSKKIVAILRIEVLCVYNFSLQNTVEIIKKIIKKYRTKVKRLTWKGSHLFLVFSVFFFKWLFWINFKGILERKIQKCLICYKVVV